MRVVLDATAIPTDRGGVGRYVDELVPQLDRTDIELTLAVQPRDVELFHSLAPASRVVAAPDAVARRPVRMAWEQVGLPGLVRRVGADLLHSPHYTMPRRAGVPTVVTLHDATFFTARDVHLRTKGMFFRAATRHAVRHAAGLVVPSQATRDETVRLLGADPDKFTVAYHGVDTDRFHPVEESETRRVHATLDIGDRPYIAFLGTLEPRKNLPALVRGWVRACDGLAQPPALVLAGGRGWDTALEAALATVPNHLTVRRTGYLPLADLAGFLAGARVLAYPSLGEGFGLPVLEGMACGATVLTTRQLALPEVGGDAVAYCGTDDQSIATELRSLLLDETRRGALATAALARAKTFTWARAAQQHIQAYRRAIELRHARG